MSLSQLSRSNGINTGFKLPATDVQPFNNPLNSLRIYKHSSSILPFVPADVCRTKNPDRALMVKILKKASKGPLTGAEIATLARISLDFDLDTTLLSSHKIGKTNSTATKEKRVQLIKSTFHKGVPRYISDDRLLYDALCLQDRTINPKFLAKIVADFPIEQQLLAFKVLAVASSFSSIHSFLQISNHPALQGREICRIGSGSISESLKYLKKKAPSDFRLPFTDKYGSNSCILLDSIAIKLIRESEEFRKFVTSTKAKLILPVGLDSGISVYSEDGLNSGSIVLKIYDSMQRVRANLAEQGCDNPSSDELESAIAKAVAQPVLDSLPKELVPNVELLVGHKRASYNEIADQLAGPRHIKSVEQVANIMIGFPGGKEEINLMRDYLLKNINYFSDLKIAETFQRIEANLRNIRGEREIVFYLPKTPGSQENKSHHLIMNLFIRTNGFADFRIIEGETDLRDHARRIERGDAKKAQVILIDDFAGTGSSHYQEYLKIRKVYKGQLAICSLGSTEKAICLREDELPFMQDFRGFAELECTDPNLYYVPGEIVGKFGPKSLSHYDSDERAVICAMAGTLGYGNIGTCVMFPYMTPNNNISAVEPFSLLFTGGAGVKNTQKYRG